jgi:hypothetical protein
MSEDAHDHRRILDGGDDLQGAAAVRAVFDVEIEDAFEQPGPTHARRRAVCVHVIGCVHGAILGWTRNDLRAQLSVRGEHAVEADLLSRNTTWPAPLRLSRALAIAGRVI